MITNWMKSNETIENMIKQYGREAFQNHREDAYAAIKAICLCAEFLQDQEDWNGERARAIPMRENREQDEWERYHLREYDKDLREVEIWRLKSELDNQELWMGEKIPLKNFLRQGLILMIEKTELRPLSFFKEDWIELMETQMMTDQYTDFRAFQEAVYVWGLFEIMKFQDGTNCHQYEGDFRDGEYLLQTLRCLIPEEEQENYDDYCAGLLKEMQRKRMETMKKVVEERDRRLERKCRERGGSPVLDLFRQKMLEMKDSEFEQLVTEQAFWEDNMSRLRRVAKLFVYGGRESKERLLQYLSEEEKSTVMGMWVAVFYPFAMRELTRRLGDMLRVAKPDWEDSPEDPEGFDKAHMESLEKIMVRDTVREDAGDGL